MEEPGFAASRTNRIAGAALLTLAILALLTVLTGFFQAPQPDEGAAAHIFQICVAAFAAASIAFLATADWDRPRKWRALPIATAILAAAFATLYYLEHVYYLKH